METGSLQELSRRVAVKEMAVSLHGSRNCSGLSAEERVDAAASYRTAQAELAIAKSHFRQEFERLAQK